jgi:uncharacterized protein
MKYAKQMGRIGGLMALVMVFASLALAGDRNHPAQTPAVQTQSDTIQNSTEKRKDIKRLMVITGSGDLGVQASNQVMGSLKSSLPDIPEEFWKEFQKEINANSMIDLIIPIYDKHFSHSDIKELITFYESPLGKRMTKALPAIMQESYTVGEKWGQEIGERAIKRLKEKGYKLN